LKRASKYKQKEEKKALMQLKTRGFGKMAQNRTMPTSLVEMKNKRKGCKVRGREAFYVFSRSSPPSNYLKN